MEGIPGGRSGAQTSCSRDVITTASGHKGAAAGNGWYNPASNGSPAPRDIGICMVAGFEGVVSRGRRPNVGETVRFLPEHCMMQKVHSGVVVHSEGNRLRIEGIDLKV